MALTVTAAQQANTANGMLLRVIVWTGAAAVQNGVTVSANSTQQSAITPGQTGSVVVCAADGPNGSYTVDAAATQLDNVTDATNGSQYLTCYATATSTSGTPETIGFNHNNTGGVALLEVLQAGTLAQDASAPAAASTTSATTVTTASFTPPAGSLLVALVSSDGGVGVTTMTVSGGSLTWTEAVKANASSADYAGIWIAQVPAASAIAAAGAPALAPGWHPGQGLPGMPGGTPFYAPWTGSTPPAQPPAVVAGVTATAALAAPAGSVSAGAVVTGVTGTVALSAPAGSISAGAVVAGVTGTVALAAPAGAAGSVTAVSGVVSTVALAAPAGTVKAGAVIAGVTATVALAAPAGVPTGVAVFDALPTTTFPATPLDGRVELLLGGTWTDISAYVQNAADACASITRGHPDESTTTAPSGIPLILNNRDARFTALNPTGPYYGQLVRNVPLRFSLPEGASYFRSETDTSSYASCPDSSGISITGDTDIRLDITLDNWQANQILACKWAAAGGERTWIIELLEAGFLRFAMSPDGTTIDSASSTVPVPLPPLRRMCVRVTVQASTGNVTFYTSPPGLSSPAWTQLGLVLSFGALSLFNSTAGIQLGFGTSTDDGYPGIYGKIHAFQLMSGIGGTVKASPDFTAQSPGTTSFSDAESNTWTLHGTSEISSRKYRIHAETSAWPQFQDPTGTDITVQLAANGILRRLGQNASGQVFQSALYRAYTRLATDIQAYWPAEDGSASTQIASGTGGPAMQFSTPPELAGFSGFLCSNPIPTLVAGSVWNGAVPPYSGGTDNVFRFLMAVPSGGDTNAAVICRMLTSGPVAYADLVYSTGGALTLNLYNSAHTLLAGNGPVAFGVNGELLRVSVELQNNGSGGISFNMTTIVVGASIGATSSATLASTAIGNVTQVVINPGGTLAATAIGQMSVQSVWDSLFDLGAPVAAWVGETAANRFSRLCTEEGIAVRIQGNADASVAMGPQTPEAVTTLLQECADADRGQIVEPRQVLGLGYRTRGSMSNQAAAVSIPYSMLMFPLLPTEDDQQLQNDVTVTQNNDGSYSEQVLDDGSPLSIGQPPNGAGRYAVSVPVNVATDAQLANEAGWILRMGTVNQPRFPAINIDLVSTESGITSLFFALLDLDIGDRVTITGLPSWLPPGQIDQLVQGVTENIWYKTLNVAWAGIPQAPWNTMVWNDPVWGKWNTDGSTLHTSVSSSATSMSVATTNPGSPLWTTAGGDFPFDVLMAGERMTVTAISGSSSPQAFTVTRSVNGVVRAQSAGAALSLYYPPVWSL